MNRFFTLLLAASCLTAVGQSGVCNYPILQVPQVVLLEGNGVWLSATSSDPLIWNLDVVADSIFVTSCGIYEVQELIDWGNGLITPCAFISVISVVSEECPETLIPSFCGEGTVWDIATSTCISANTADINNDGCVQLNDLLDLLSAYGNCVGSDTQSLPCDDQESINYQGYDYQIVQIGEQCWFAENLRCESYGNGDAILSIEENQFWRETGWQLNGDGAQCVYDNNPDVFLDLFGRLYNWYSVVDPRGICPSGWHVPTHNDWIVLADFLGGQAVAGLLMKASSPGWNGTNESGFSGLPGSLRFGDTGAFAGSTGAGPGSDGYWWSASPNVSSAWNRGIRGGLDELQVTHSDPRSGLSVRCIKDAE